MYRCISEYIYSKKLSKYFQRLAGSQILGYFWNPISSDREVISAKSVGGVIEFYWNDITRYFFKSEYIEAIVMYDDMNTQPF